MVCNLTVGKEKYVDVQDEIKDALKKSETLRKKLTELIDKDTEAFNDVMKAFKMPKETEDQKKKRSAAIQEGYKTAAMVPFETAKTCAEILDVAKIIAEKGNVNSITDAAVSAIMAKAGVKGAILNVEINLGSIKDEAFVKKMSADLTQLQENTVKKTDEILGIVNNKM
jgi:formiminotetrahydrofolate cyclodeaminase